jgi:hypothetical protein
MREYLLHINTSFVDSHTEDVLSRYTALDTTESAPHTVCLVLRDWSNFGGIPLAVEIPEVSWSRPVAPLTVASHILPERRAWALARSFEAKPPCGCFPQDK